MSTSPRFYTMQDVGEVLSVSVRQVRTLLVSGDLRGIQVGGKGQWRIEHDELEKYISRQYELSDQRTRSDSASDNGNNVRDRVEHDNSAAT